MFEQKYQPASCDSDAQPFGSDLPSRTAARESDIAARARSFGAAMADLSPTERLTYLRQEIAGPIIFSHGFGVEGQLIFH
jgi:hypothetical protein